MSSRERHWPDWLRFRLVADRTYRLDDRDAERITTLYRVAELLAAPAGHPGRLSDAQVQALRLPGHHEPIDRQAAAANLRRAAKAIEEQLGDARTGQGPHRVRTALADITRALVVAGILAVGSATPASPASTASRTSPASSTIAASQSQPARPRREDRPEQPHAPELEVTELPGQEVENLERHVLVLDDPRYGVLNGQNYLGYCESCLLVGQVCHGPCPGLAQLGQYAAMHTLPAD
jgi:hypothetical protein